MFSPTFPDFSDYEESLASVSTRYSDWSSFGRRLTQVSSGSENPSLAPEKDHLLSTTTSDGDLGVIMAARPAEGAGAWISFAIKGNI